MGFTGRFNIPYIGSGVVIGKDNVFYMLGKLPWLLLFGSKVVRMCCAVSCVNSLSMVKGKSIMYRRQIWQNKR